MIMTVKQIILKALVRKGSDVKFGYQSLIDKKCIFLGMNSVGSRTALYDCVVGVGSYVASNSLMINVDIGAFCSIGDHVVIAPGMHPTRTFVSSHPAFFSRSKTAGFTFSQGQTFCEQVSNIKAKGRSVAIGNDVWIGSSATILGGITIGDGAVIGAGSVVTKDVDSYSVVAGVPAKQLRKRFTDEQCAALSEIQWWKNDVQWLRKHASEFSDISQFIANHGVSREV